MTSPRARPRAARRRQFGAILVVMGLGAIAAVAWPRDDAPAARASVAPIASLSPGSSNAPSRTASAAAQPTSSSKEASAPAEMPPAWLAWPSGGLTPGFRVGARELTGLDATVVVAGDTLWMTESRNEDGAVVDRPTPPYRIPIDVFAVNAEEYAPFLPGDARDEIVSALRDGNAVLSEASAALRRLGTGGSLVFGDQTIRVGAVVPNDLVGWSEMMVSRETGARFGIANERYMLALTQKDFTENSFRALIAPLLAPGTRIRVDAPGTTPYVRVASGVRPVVIFKRVFGEFAAAPASPDGVYLAIDPKWVAKHIVTREVPLLGRVECNRRLFPPLVGALEELQADGLGGLIHTYSGCWAARTVARSPTAPPSYHSYGAAIDINAPENPYGAIPTMDMRIVKVFERWGFNWGGDFLTPDGHHFEYWGAPKAS
jgi:D-alanyl-D-alanine carboxypeptidase-like protein